MQNILVPTDFSPIAGNALDFAIELAAKFGSKIFLYHVYTFHRKVDFNYDFAEDQQPYVKNIERRMNFIKQKFMDKFERKGVAFETKISEGHIYDLFKDIVEEHEIDLIVMGSKGASGLEKVIFGTVAAAALDLAEVPVLIIPPKHTFQPIEKVVFSTDLKGVSSKVTSPLRELALVFKSAVTILFVNTGESKDVHWDSNSHFKGVETTFQEVHSSTSINESISAFIEANAFSLLCMVRREKGFFESLFKKSISKSQVFNSNIPLLILPEN